MPPARTAWRGLVGIGTVLAAAGAANTARNLRIMAAPPPTAPAPDRPVSVLLPLRNEAHRVLGCLRALRALPAEDCAEIVVLDDASTDGTAEVVRAELGDDPRLVLLTGEGDPPRGWLGKPWACARLADAATGEVLVFCDADVILSPDAIRRALAMRSAAGYDIICPYPRQHTSGPLGRLVQPLLQWSWLTTLPLDVAARSSRGSTAAGNGQFLIVDAATYRRAGGHRAVRAEVLEDVALVRAGKRVGAIGGMADGTALAECTMYADDAELVAGYTKSLWSAFGSPAAAAAAVSALLLAYVVPPVAAVIGPDRRTRAIGAVGYAAAVAGRVAVARRTGQRSWPDAAAHPASIIAFAGLVAESWRRLRRGELTWSGRPVVAGPPDTAGLER